MQRKKGKIDGTMEDARSAKKTVARISSVLKCFQIHIPGEIT